MRSRCDAAAYTCDGHCLASVMTSVACERHDDDRRTCVACDGVTDAGTSRLRHAEPAHKSLRSF